MKKQGRIGIEISEKYGLEISYCYFYLFILHFYSYRQRNWLFFNSRVLDLRNKVHGSHRR